jgi:hypothetical protein
MPVSYVRRKTRPDATQAAIVEGLRKAGIIVYVIGQPCDLLTYYPPMKRWRTLECKPLIKRNRNDQEEQVTFLAVTGTKIVRTAEEAIQEVLR